MSVISELIVGLGLNSSNFNSGLSDAENRAKGAASSIGASLAKVGAGLSKAGTTLTLGLTAPIVAFGVKATMMASDLEESMNAVNVVFGQSAGIIHNFGAQSAVSAGMAESEFNGLAATMGAFLKNVGYSLDETAQETIGLTQRAADMASIFNTDVAQALAAIQSGLKGEFNPLEQFGVKINAAAIEAKALAMGLAGTKEELTDSMKAAASLALIYEQTDQFAGDFLNTSDGLANSTKILTARANDLVSRLGVHLLPIGTKIVNFLGDMVSKFEKLTPEMEKTILIVIGIVAAIGPGLFILGKLIAFLSPVAAIIALIAAGIAIWKSNLFGIQEFIAPIIEFAENLWRYIQGIRESGDVLNDWITRLPQWFQDAVFWASGFWDKLQLIKKSLQENGFWSDETRKSIEAAFGVPATNLLYNFAQGLADAKTKLGELKTEFDIWFKHEFPIYVTEVEILQTALGKTTSKDYEGLTILGEVLGVIGINIGNINLVWPTLSELLDAMAKFAVGTIAARFAQWAGTLEAFNQGMIAFEKYGTIFGEKMLELIDTIFDLHQNMIDWVEFITDFLTGGDWETNIGSWTALWETAKDALDITWTLIELVFETAYGVIDAMTYGFTAGVTQYFLDLNRELVGESIIPDMMTAMETIFGTSFANIITSAAGFVTDMIDKMSGMAVSIGEHLAGIRANFSSMQSVLSSGVHTPGVLTKPSIKDPRSHKNTAAAGAMAMLSLPNISSAAPSGSKASATRQVNVNVYNTIANGIDIQQMTNDVIRQIGYAI